MADPIHGSIPTTTGKPEPAPQILLTKGSPKRSWAAVEPEFVDNNDMNAMAPSSAVLQTEFLIMDDAHLLDDRVDMSERVFPSTSSGPAPSGPPTKRPRYSNDIQTSAADYAQLDPIIQPSLALDNPPLAPTSQTSLGSMDYSPTSVSLATPSSPSRVQVLSGGREETGDSVDHKVASSSHKKTSSRPIRIQLLDEKESAVIRDQALREASSSTPKSQQDQDQGLLLTPLGFAENKDSNEEQGEGLEGTDIALPLEDPVVHDWDQEELEGDIDIKKGLSGASDTYRARRTSTRRQSILKDIQRAAMSGGESMSSSSEYHPPWERAFQGGHPYNGDEDDGEGSQDSMRDPERDTEARSESQEAESHNVHLRQENQRDFQDAAGLDLGEDDAQAMNEDGRYGGAIEDDDEGEDYWENR